MGCKKERLREGFTTGSAAAAAAKAALLYMGGQRELREVGIPLPVGKRLTIPVEGVEDAGGGVRATVIKDAGDDPDVTHHARIGATVHLTRDGVHGHVTIEGGAGVGRVTRPGLPVPVGEAAINPVPREQIREALREGLAETGLRGAVSVTIDVEEGEEIAKRTLNPRLGIVGGISILGTRGTVKPFSHASYRDTITVSMDVAKAGGADAMALSTGGKSEGFLRRMRPELPEVSFVQAGDFFSFSLKEAAKRGFREILYACFFGKLVKMAQGHACTHATKSRIDFAVLAGWCGALGMGRENLCGVRRANTAREALGLIKADPRRDNILRDIAGRAIGCAGGFAGASPLLSYYLFDFEGSLLSVVEGKGQAQEIAD